ncbi:protein HEAT-STRESS-ASSOCIATED 32-like [Selaginella moellendorffii]|uniref:protein HEAT-STRESS-ASSOCIATED 32-like n=1 Tax=Selaginella moellendorffii TaxID=88036 RepID=UPI000D1C7B8F|nr:protein HEAT-STRESS-ASSOCIATED 32-like [Selaginella moellendorffii]|eukprot:XP_024539899.1 protein HEAT-STRESS-ASSOCIATED 32-like [Selaginella moellendorffii]
MFGGDVFFMDRAEKPRITGRTEIRGPYHSFFGSRYLEQILESSGSSIDGLQFSNLMSRSLLRDMIELAHRHGIYVSSGGWGEDVLGGGRKSFKQYVQDCKDLGFDMIEFDVLCDKIAKDDFLYLTRMIKNEGLKPKPGLFLFEEDAKTIIETAENFIGAGADVIRLESDLDILTTDVIAKLIERVGLDRLIFQAREPKVFEWFITNYGRQVPNENKHSRSITANRTVFYR